MMATKKTPKALVHTTGRMTHEVEMSSEGYEIRKEHAHGHSISRYSKKTLADFSGHLEVYVDVDRLLRQYAKKVFNAKTRRMVRGPIEIRAVDLRQVSEVYTRDSGPGMPE